MTWPTNGTSGWEAFGTPIITKAELWPLPVASVANYYDPTRLNGIGAIADQGVLAFNGAGVVTRSRVGSVECRFTAPNVWSDGLLDWMIVLDYDPCSLVLDVYADDRTTILWSVGTSPRHERPWLIEPETYAEQEIDVAAGAATLGTVSVLVIDKTTAPGNQDAGWLTAQLASVGIANLAGRRCRLRRFVNPELGFYIVADGPAGTPRLDSSYVAFSWDIRDTREGERKIRLFDVGIDQPILPDAPEFGYGWTGLAWLVPPGDGLRGVWDRTNLYSPGMPYTVGYVDLTSMPGNSDNQITMTTEAYQQVVAYGGGLAPLGVLGGGPVSVRWRAQGSADPWTEVRADLLLELIPPVVPSGTPRARPRPDTVVTGVTPETIMIPALRLGAWSDDADLVPYDGQSIEFLVFGSRGVPPTTDHPLYIDGMAAGVFAQNVYDGLYSQRQADGAVTPTGILYDEAAVLAMTDPIRVRLTAPVEDARDWLEKNIYAPLGYVPALDDVGQISPLSQVAPTTADGLLSITDPITAPAPDWSAGERVINVLTMSYQRDYVPTALMEVASRDISVEFVDPVSVARYGRQVLEMTGEAFRAVGDGAGEPLSGDTTAEAAYILASARQTYVQARYAFGAPAFTVPVMRSATIGLRAGSWIVVDLSWLPDYVTQRRGLIGLGQVMALGDLDCIWRKLLIEMVTPLGGPGS